MTNTTGFRIRVTISNPSSQYNAYVCIERNGICPTWDGSWYTREDREPQYIKVWKTRGGAQRWLDQRSGVRNMGAVIEAAPGR
jgi:hypothetical protein